MSEQRTAPNTARPGTIIRTPDQRLRVFVSSTLQELAEERAAAREAIIRLRLTPVMFEIAARPHPPQDLYRAYLDQSHIFVGIYWERYGWVAPDMNISGLEDEYDLSGGKPKLIYIKTPAPNREQRLQALLDRIRSEGSISYKSFETTPDLQQLVENDLAVLLTERFEVAQGATSGDAMTAVLERIRFDNLPAPVTELIGRTDEVQTIRDLILHDDVRLVTLYGAGGIGKTRLAIEVAREIAHEFEDGVCFVSLESVRVPGQVGPTIAQTLGLGEANRPSLATTERIKTYLRDRHMLLVLDNFEQVLSAGTLVAELLVAAPKLKVIVTSRAVLRVRGEYQFDVQPLSVSDADTRHASGPGEVSLSDAARLFVARAHAVKPDFEITPDNAAAVADICARLDGLPLAIELAAARVKLLTAQAIQARLMDMEVPETRLFGGTQDMPPRQQTLRQTQDWSYDLLEAAEQRLFARLSVFVGGWTMKAATDVCGSNADEPSLVKNLESLIDKSFVILMSNGRSNDDQRFTMLNMIHEYAIDQLEAMDEAHEVRRRHAQYFLKLAQCAESELKGAHQQQWVRRLECDDANLQEALNWFIENNQADTAALMGWTLESYWMIASRGSEGLHWMTAALAHLQIESSAGADTLTSASATPSVSQPQLLARAQALAITGLWTALQGDWERATIQLDEGLAISTALGNKAIQATVKAGLGITKMSQGDYASARTQFEESLRLSHEVGDIWKTVMILNGIGRLALQQHDFETAERVFRECQALLLAHGDTVTASGWTLFASFFLARASLGQGDVAGAAAKLKEALKAAAASGYLDDVAYGLDVLARIACDGHDGLRAARLLGAANRTRELIGVPVWAPERPAHERLIADARLQADAAFEQAWQEGEAMTTQQALEFALAG